MCAVKNIKHEDQLEIFDFTWNSIKVELKLAHRPEKKHADTPHWRLLDGAETSDSALAAQSWPDGAAILERATLPYKRPYVFDFGIKITRLHYSAVQRTRCHRHKHKQHRNKKVKNSTNEFTGVIVVFFKIKIGTLVNLQFVFSLWGKWGRKFVLVEKNTNEREFKGNLGSRYDLFLIYYKEE